MKNVAVILAAGSGSRAGAGMPKQFRSLPDGRTVLETCVAQFEDCAAVDETVIVTSTMHVATVQQLMLGCGWQKVSRIITGGETRAESSYNALKALSEDGEEKNVLIHDGARPFVSQRILDDVCRALKTHEAVTVAVACTDTIYETTGGEDMSLRNIPPRQTLCRAQTPQAFRLNLIKQAFERLTEQERTQSTDDAGVLHKAMPKVRIHIINGEEANRKITFKEDLI